MIAAASWLFYLGVTRAPEFNAPPWVAYALAAIFLSGGAQVVANALGRAGGAQWVAFIFLAGIAAVFWWIALASDPRECLASFGPIPLPGRVCKIGFGCFAAFSTAYAIFVARRLLFPRPKSYY
jgi:hypothetical protein